MNFRAALLCSALMHFGLLGLSPPSSWLPSRESLSTLEVFYVGATAAQQPAAVQPPPPPEPRPSAQRRVAAPPLRFHPEMSREAGPPLAPAAAPPGPTAPDGRWKPPPLPAGSVSLPEQEFSEVEHKERVRRHLKARLSYPAVPASGTVRIRLLLGPSGALREARVLEASDPRLAVAALRDLQQAVPYPRFPQPMRRPEADYEFLVRYQPETQAVQ